MKLPTSQSRVYEHGEVFTPPEIVDRMLGHVQEELNPYDSRVLEPACGSGNFLIPILSKKLRDVDEIYGSNSGEHLTRGLHATMSIYGIELLRDNVVACRNRLLRYFADWVGPDEPQEWVRAAENVVHLNVVHGDARTLKQITGEPVQFSEWSIAGDLCFDRREFQLADLLASNDFAEATLFDPIDPLEMFTPVRAQLKLGLQEIAELSN
ncbi:MAG: N-6 DNA methylase [Akkermansiaceae bacterium]